MKSEKNRNPNLYHLGFSFNKKSQGSLESLKAVGHPEIDHAQPNSIYSDALIENDQLSQVEVSGKCFQLIFKNSASSLSILGEALAITEASAIETSRLACSFFLEEFNNKLNFSGADLQGAIKKLNRLIFEKGLEDIKLSGAGLSLAAVVSSDDGYQIAHLGNVRVYGFFEDADTGSRDPGKCALKQLTVDHTLTQELNASEGERADQYISPADRLQTDSILTKYIGKAPDIEAGFTFIKKTANLRQAESFPAKIVMLTAGTVLSVTEERLFTALCSVNIKQGLAEALESSETGKAELSVLILSGSSFDQPEAPAVQVEALDSDNDEESDDIDFDHDQLKDEIRQIHAFDEEDGDAEYHAVDQKPGNDDGLSAAIEEDGEEANLSSYPSDLNYMEDNQENDFIEVEDPLHREDDSDLHADKADDEDFCGVHEVNIPIVLDPTMPGVHRSHTSEENKIGNGTPILTATDASGGIFRPAELNAGTANFVLGKASEKKKAKIGGPGFGIKVAIGLGLGLVVGLFISPSGFKKLTYFMSSNKQSISQQAANKSKSTRRQADSDEVDRNLNDSTSVESDSKGSLRYSDDSETRVAKGKAIEAIDDSPSGSLKEKQLAALEADNDAQLAQISYDGYQKPLIATIDNITDPDVKLMFQDVVAAIQNAQENAEKQFVTVALKQEQIASKINDLSEYITRLGQIIEKKEEAEAAAKDAE